jgi:hypothetical protein
MLKIGVNPVTDDLAQATSLLDISQIAHRNPQQPSLAEHGFAQVLVGPHVLPPLWALFPSDEQKS